MTSMVAISSWAFFMLACSAIACFIMFPPPRIVCLLIYSVGRTDSGCSVAPKRDFISRTVGSSSSERRAASSASAERRSPCWPAFRPAARRRRTRASRARRDISPAPARACSTCGGVRATFGSTREAQRIAAMLDERAIGRELASRAADIEIADDARPLHRIDGTCRRRPHDGRDRRRRNRGARGAACRPRAASTGSGSRAAPSRAKRQHAHQRHLEAGARIRRERQIAAAEDGGLVVELHVFGADLRRQLVRRSAGSNSSSPS